ncbi:MAG: cysteate synthase [Bacteroidales bacterium]
MAENFQPTNYWLESVKTGKQFGDSGWILTAPGEDGSSLVRAKYEKAQIDIKPHKEGLYKFMEWLPIHRKIAGSYAPFTYKSKGLAEYLNLNNLYITFSGYWPQNDVLMRTCSFKETEAYSVCGRLPDDNDKILVVASAGNTARAFAHVCSDNNIPLLLCVPEDNLDALWFDGPLNENVKLVAIRTGGDYFDAIHLSNLACEIDGFIPEGGAKNVARRDGMGTTVLSAVEVIKQIPDYYFQAVGSGTGAIAAWEANLRLIEDGRFGKNKMKLMVSQNEPFIPLYDAWKADSRELFQMNDDEARKEVEAIIAKVLSNRKPPYGIYGGLYDALKDTEGEVLIANNKEAKEAGEVFEELEEIDIHPAAAVATASLMKAVEEEKVDRDAIIMLNITGGGEKLFKKENHLHYLEPSHIFDINPDKEVVKSVLSKLFLNISKTW